MRSMLGKKLKVVAVLENGVIALPSPDGSQNGRWYFMKSVVHKPGTQIRCERILVTENLFILFYEKILISNFQFYIFVSQ